MCALLLLIRQGLAALLLPLHEHHLPVLLPAFGISLELLAVQLLTGQGIAALLLAVHERLQQACHPRHKLQVMASMQAVVRLLGPRVTSPPVFKYLTHILLQQVQVRSAISSGPDSMCLFCLCILLQQIHSK